MTETLPISIVMSSFRKNVNRSFRLLRKREGIILSDYLRENIYSSLEEELEEELRSPVPRDVKVQIFYSLEQELGAIDRKKSSGRIAEEFNKRFKKEFERERKSQNGEYYNSPVQFDGQYGVNFKDISYVKLFANEGGYGCPLIPIDPERSIIARALVTGLDQHIPDTSKDPAHWECVAGEVFNEEVYPIFSQPITKGPLTGYRVAVGVFDFDFFKTHTLTKRESIELGRIIRPYGELIFPGEPKFEYKAQGPIYIMSPQEARKRGLDKVA